MTDEEALAQLPRVEELVEAVAEHDEAAVWACLTYTNPGTLAVLAAGVISRERNRIAELERVEAAYVRQATEKQKLRSQVDELRDIVINRKRKKVLA